jgi:hypothetical protein
MANCWPNLYIYVMLFIILHWYDLIVWKDN